MEKKPDVKAMMARFQSGASTDETPTMPVGRKQPLHSSLSSGLTTQTKKPITESLSSSALNIPPKPNFQKHTVLTKSDTAIQEPSKTKALSSRFENAKEDTDTNKKPLITNKQQVPLKPAFSLASEAKGPSQNTPLNKPSLSSTLSDSKPKPCPPLTSKPSWVKDDSSGGLQKKPSSILKLMQQHEQTAEAGTNTVNKPSPQTNSALKSPSNFKAAQNLFNKDSDSSAIEERVSKQPLTASNSTPPPKPLASKKPSIKIPKAKLSSEGDDSSEPKRSPLPNSLALGPAPAKPNRPPKVDLGKFKRGAPASDNVSVNSKKPNIPTPLASHPSNHSNHETSTQPPQPAVPSLPPRHPGAMIQQDECYDDIAPPPLPPTTDHPSQRAKAQEEDDDEDGEMYEDLDERWEAVEQKQEKKREKEEKEEKKRLEAEKKEQKDREKKEQDARKKFKLVGPIEVIHQGKARSDCKGSKTDLALKQGDCLDIIRVTGNPEGRWLGRTQEGCIGYVKTTSVEIDFNTLKNRQPQQAYEPEVYDDIDVASADNSGRKGPGVVLPPPPDEDGEIYDDVIDPNLEFSPTDSSSSTTKPKGFLWMFDRNRRPASSKVVPPPSQFTAEGNSDQGAAIDEEIYDDVDSQNTPPPPPISSLPGMKGRIKSDEIDPKKQKKFEKEEKDFRKKFKYDGVIQVLYQVTISSTLTNKKWGVKELPVKAGEKLDVIVRAVDNKMICRNEDGKFGYVSTNHIDMDDGEIYDDIGDDCIYDND